MMRYFFSGVVLYGLVIYIISWENLLHQDSSCVLLGFLGLVSCNPANYWLQDYPSITRVLDAFIQAVFVNYMRFFLFERIRAVVNPKPSIFVQCFFCALCMADFWSETRADWALMRAVAGSRTLHFAPRSLCRAVMTGAYAFLIVSQWIHVCCREHELPHEKNRILCFGTVQFVAFLASSLQISGDWVPSIAISAAPKLLVLATHFTGAAACLFWVKEFQNSENNEQVSERFVLDTSD
jgi:hypothetical protein